MQFSFTQTLAQQSKILSTFASCGRYAVLGYIYYDLPYLFLCFPGMISQNAAKSQIGKVKSIHSKGYVE